MGELNITINDLGACTCGRRVPMIFEVQEKKKVKGGWFISCAACGHKTETHVELLDAADEWGLKESDED